MDPLTAFAAAGNALQFVQLGVDIISKTIEYARGGGHREFRTLSGCVERLSVSNGHLQSSMESNAAQLLPPGPARALHAANVECLRLSRDVATTLDNLGLNKPHSLWNSVKLALKSQVNKHKLEDFSKKLDHARANLMLSLMVFLTDQSAVNWKGASQQSRMIAEETMKITAESKSMQKDIAKLSQSLSAIRIKEPDAPVDLAMMMKQRESQLNIISTMVEDVLRKHKTYLASLITGLSEHLRQLDNEVKIMSQEVRQLLPTMTREILARRQILESIRFSKIDHRRNRITRAHGDTYSWIFRHKENESVVWHDFVDWLRDGEHPVYWVSGKPGSGKSTLMRELDERTNEFELSQGTDTDLEFLKASFYFWSAGNNEQKSMSGLLRSLLHQLLLPHPEIVDEVISTRRWEAALAAPSHLREWEEDELAEVLCKTVQHLQGSRKILLLVDGLDEHDGSDEERQEVLNLLQTLTQNNRVRACLASRRWNIFKDAFADSPQLRLEDLTKDDIRLYVCEKLCASPHFQRLQRNELELLRIISEEIVGKARGVFLWVRLVVRDLLRVLRDGGRLKHLLKELGSIPPDLDNYFQRIFESIEKTYRREASIILQTALCVMDRNAHGISRRDSASDFLLTHLHFVEESDDLGFAAKSHLQPIEFHDSCEEQEFLEPLERMLASRSMGLLEIGTDDLFSGSLGTALHPWKTRIEFLHRTVRDYFASPTALQLLRQYTDGPFDAHLFRCNLLITNMNINTNLMLSSCPSLRLKHEWVENFFCQIRNRPEDDETCFALFDKMAELVTGQAYSLGRWASSVAARSDLGESLTHWYDQHGCAMSLAIQLGWTTYIQKRLHTKVVQRKQGRPLIDYALRPSFWKPRPPDSNIVRILLSSGACPDDMIEEESSKTSLWSRESSPGTAHTEIYHIPTWAYYLVSIPFVKVVNFDVCLDTIKALLAHGAHALVTVSDMIQVFDGVQVSKVTRHSVSAFCDRLRGIKGSVNDTDNPPRPRNDDRYSFLDVLQSLMHVFKGGQEYPMFTDLDVAALKDIVKSTKHSSQCQHRLPPTTLNFRPDGSTVNGKRGRETPCSHPNELSDEPAETTLHDKADWPECKKARYG